MIHNEINIIAKNGGHTSNELLCKRTGLCIRRCARIWFGFCLLATALRFSDSSQIFSFHFLRLASKMITDSDLGFIANFLGIFIFALVIAYHYVLADPKYEGN
ncbi:hypothetical protein LXL04_012427 [Taraxacum kok-saghyz]